MKRLSLSLFLLLFGLAASAQDAYVPLNSDVYHLIDRYQILHPDSVRDLHTGLRPYRRSDVARLAASLAPLSLESAGESPIGPDPQERVSSPQPEISKADRYNLRYLLADNWQWRPEYNKATDEWDERSKKPLLKHFYKNRADLYHVDNEDFRLRVNPVIHFQYMKETDNDRTLFINTRGVQVEGDVDRRVGFYGFVADNQAAFPDYVFARQLRDSVLAGEGFYKRFKQTQGQYDFFTARGYITARLTKHINMQLGHDRNFIGNGYRSLVLSDFAPAMFFLKFNTRVWKLHYQNLFAELTADYQNTNRLFPKKYMAYHHLSVNLGKSLNIGVFESVIAGRDYGRFELQYLNPIIFYRSVEQGLGSQDNALLGADFRWNIKNRVQVYGQVMLDEFLLKEIKARKGWWGNKQAAQFGVKYINVAGLKNLDIQGEANLIRPYMYQHRSLSTSYTHYEQPLAHPMGANLYEFIGIVRYQPIGPLMLTAKLIATTYGADADTSQNYGSNPLLGFLTREGEYGHKLAGANQTQLLHMDFTASYQVKQNIFIDLKFIQRQSTSPVTALDYSRSIGSVAFRWNIPQRLQEF